MISSGTANDGGFKFWTSMLMFVHNGKSASAVPATQWFTSQEFAPLYILPRSSGRINGPTFTVLAAQTAKMMASNFRLNVIGEIPRLVHGILRVNPQMHTQVDSILEDVEPALIERQVKLNALSKTKDWTLVMNPSPVNSFITFTENHLCCLLLDCNLLGIPF